MVDVFIFNPPTFPRRTCQNYLISINASSFPSKADTHLLALSYAGGADGMETTDRLLDALPEILTTIEVVHISCFVHRTSQRT